MGKRKLPAADEPARPASTSSTFNNPFAALSELRSELPAQPPPVPPPAAAAPPGSPLEARGTMVVRGDPARSRPSGGQSWREGTRRDDLEPGLTVEIVLKRDQRSGALTRGVIQDVLTPGATHPRGIKVRLTDGSVGRVKRVLDG